MPNLESSDDKVNEKAIKEIEFRKKAVFNMWVIICTIFIADTYATLYSMTLAIWGGKDCYVQDEVWVKSLSTVTERTIHYILWLFPVMWIFWPPEARCSCGRKLKKTDAN